MFKDLLSDADQYKLINPLWFVVSLVVSVLMFFTGQFIPILLIATALIMLGNDQEAIESLLSDNLGLQLFATIFIASATVFLVYKYTVWRGNKPLKHMLMRPKAITWSQVGDVVMTYGVYFMTLLFATLILSEASAVDVNQSQELGINTPETFITKLGVFMMLVVVPPIFEEIVFRGFLYNTLKQYGGQVVSAICVSVLFGLAHLEYDNLNWIAVVDTLIFSFFLIYISQKHKSLYSAMLLHAIKNGIAFYVLFIR
jgi:membrane protease YdiL (CAAX protease family)